MKDANFYVLGDPEDEHFLVPIDIIQTIAKHLLLVQKLGVRGIPRPAEKLDYVEQELEFNSCALVKSKLEDDLWRETGQEERELVISIACAMVYALQCHAANGDIKRRVTLPGGGPVA